MNEKGDGMKSTMRFKPEDPEISKHGDIEERCFGKSRDMPLKISQNGEVEPLLDVRDVIKELKFMQEQNKAAIALLQDIRSIVNELIPFPD